MHVFLIVIYLFGASPAITDKNKGGFRVALRTKQVLNVEEVAEEKNMLLFVETNGQVTAVSKALVDWYQVYFNFPALFEMYCPDETKQALLVRFDREKRNRNREKRDRRNIILTTSDLKKMPDYKYHDLFSKFKTSSTSQSKKKGKPKKNDGRKIIKVISHGKQVTLTKHLESGRYVIFDFYADWCGPCRQLTPTMEKLVSDFPGHVALKKIDIKNWRTPVASQHGIRSIPYVILYGPDGKKVGGVGARNLESFIRGKAREASW